MKLHGAIVSIALTITGCVRDSVEPPALGPIETATAGGEHDPWQPGTHYLPVQPFAETNVPAGRVTVVEFFWYGSPQCYTLDPHLVLWNRRKPEDVEFKRVPTTWGQYDRPHARLFYTLEALGRSDLHGVIFDTIHAKGNRLANTDERQTLQLQLQFATEHGIAAKKFLAAHNSSAVAERVSRAEQMLLHYQVDKLPTLIVNGKYKTDVTRTGRSGEMLVRLIGDLAAGETAVDLNRDNSAD